MATRPTRPPCPNCPKKQKAIAASTPQVAVMQITDVTEGRRLWRHVLFGTSTCVSMLEGYAEMQMPGECLEGLQELKDRLQAVVTTIEDHNEGRPSPKRSVPTHGSQSLDSNERRDNGPGPEPQATGSTGLGRSGSGSTVSDQTVQASPGTDGAQGTGGKTQVSTKAASAQGSKSSSGSKAGSKDGSKDGSRDGDKNFYGFRK